MKSLQFLHCNPATSERAKKIPKHLWDAHRQTIEDLYIQQDETMEDLMSVMSEQYAFVVT
jgi:Clr5 domain